MSHSKLLGVSPLFKEVKGTKEGKVDQRGKEDTMEKGTKTDKSGQKGTT
jgi:hypothetical protein